MHTTIYVDGDQGTTGLRIVQRLSALSLRLSILAKISP